MEPQANNLENAPKNTPEQSPEIATSPDLNRKLEKVPIGALEQIGGNESHERGAIAPQDPALGTETTIPTIQPPIQDDVAGDGDGVVQAPPVAADEDVIEKEWVNKAKKVINQTKGDPYAKEREVSKLQADYMQKRYGKQVKMPDEQ